MLALVGPRAHSGSKCIQLPDSLFDICELITTYTIPYLNAAMEGLPEDTLMPLPYVPPQTAHATLTTTCFLMYLPHGLAHLMLDSKGYTPRDTWMQL